MRPSPVPRRAYTECRFGQLHLLHAAPVGGASAPPLLLFHQNPSTSEEYRHLVAAMATDRAVYAFDTPGYGMSDRPRAPLSIAGYCEALVEGIEALGLADAGAVDLFGFHTGTLLAIEVARLLGARCGRIVLSGIPFRPAHERQARLDEIHAVEPPSDDGDAIFDRLRWLWRFVVAHRAQDVTIDRAATMFMERAKPLHRYWWAYEGVWTYPIDERLAAIAQPTLVLIPDEMLAEHSRAAAALIPTKTLVDMPDLHRDIFEPEAGCAAIAAALRAFLV
jgi:pimeloyl-ACP methyl ester carboxylesterase